MAAAANATMESNQPLSGEDDSFRSSPTPANSKRDASVITTERDTSIGSKSAVMSHEWREC